MKETQVPYEIIIKFFRDECNHSELEFLNSWRSYSSENETILNQLRAEWTFFNDENYIYPNKKNIWEHIYNLTLKEHKIIREKDFGKSKKTLLLWKTAGISAIIALFIVLGITFTITKQKDSQETKLAQLTKQTTVISTPRGQKTQLTLPDGTQVWLNSNSKLTYSGNFNQQSREVSLEGEGFFDVVNNPGKQFIVNTSHIKISVLGTAFDVQAYPEDPDIKISLVRGKVAFESQEKQYLGELNPDQSIVISKKNMYNMKSNKYLGKLIPGQMVVISKKDLHYALHSNVDTESFSKWTKDQLTFYNADINQIIPELERWYDVKINFINPDKNQKYSFTVKTESLSELLNLFNKITPIKYTVNGKEVEIIKQ